MAILSDGERQEISAVAHFVLSQRPRSDRLERRFHLRHARRRRDRDPASAVRQLAAARIPPLRRTPHQELENVYDFLEAGGTGLWSRWRTARAASKLHTVLLDVNELTERADNAIKFLSDMFSARLYKLAPKKSASPTTKTWSKKNSRPPRTSTASWSSNSIKAAPSSSN